LWSFFFEEDIMRRKILFSILWLSLLASVSDSRGQSNEQARLVVQTGHTGGVTSLAFGPGGKTLASASVDSDDKTIKLWDVASGQELRTVSWQPGDSFSEAFSSDGKTLAGGYRDGTIKLFDVASGKELRTLSGHFGRVFSVAFGSDGKTLASGGEDNTIKLWDVASGKELKTLSGDLGPVFSVAFSSDGKTLASGSVDEIKLWAVVSGKELRALKGHSNRVVSVAFSPDGKTLASGTWDNTVKLWDVTRGTELRTLKGHSDFVTSVAFSADGETLASGSDDKTIKLWDVTSGTELRSLKGHADNVTSVAFSPDRKTLASGSADETIKLWDVASGTELRSLTGHSAWVSSVAFSSDEKILASGSGDLTVKLWDVSIGTELRTLKGHSDSVNSVAFSPDGKTLASGSRDHTVKLWDVARRRELRTLKGHSSNVESVAFSPDGKTLVSGSLDKTIRLWNVASGAELRALTGHSAYVLSVAFSPDGKTLASGSQDHTVKLWDVASGKELKTLSGYGSVSFSPDGKTLAAQRNNNDTIQLWDVASGKELKTLSGDSEVDSVSFSSDGKTLASGSEDNTIQLWDVASGTLLRTLTGHTARVSAVSFSANGKFLFSGGPDGKIKLWDVQSGNELASLIALDESDWAVVTPNGLFDASPGARKLMHYAVGMEVVTLDQMKDLYYVPGLLQKVMKGDPLPKVQLFTAQDLFPEAEYEQPKPGQKTFTVKLRNRGGGIGQVQVLVNATEVIADARPVGFDPQSKEATLTIDLSNVKQLIPGKENKVEVIARNTAGSLSSKNSARGAELVVVDEGRVLTEPPELYAIIGGVSEYVDNHLDLRYSAKDAEDFARALEIGATKFLGKDKVHIRLLTSDKVEDKKLLSSPDSNVLTPSKENFRKVFAEFAGKTKQNDILVVYMSGHGVALKQQGGDSYLYPTQEAYTTDNSALAEEKIRTATTVSSEELVQWIRDIGASRKALVLDTCAAGAAAESLIARKDVPSDQIRALERLKDRTGFFVLMGSAADKVSYETTTYRQGLLTYALLEGLKGAKLHDGGYANVGQLFDYAQDRVPQLARNIGAIQQPRFLAPDIGSPFDLGLYTADEQKLFSLPNPNPLILRPSLQNKDLGYDNLKLLPALQKALFEASYASPRGGNEPLLVFVDASEMPDAFMPVGSYTVAGGTVTIQLNLIRNDKPVTTLTIEGPVTDEQSKAVLIRKVIEAISAETQKLIH
jgi:WD40 repeat protein/uncharacterized caspase-like protein